MMDINQTQVGSLIISIAKIPLTKAVKEDGGETEITVPAQQTMNVLRVNRKKKIVVAEFLSAEAGYRYVVVKLTNTQFVILTPITAASPQNCS